MEKTKAERDFMELDGSEFYTFDEIGNWLMVEHLPLSNVHALYSVSQLKGGEIPTNPDEITEVEVMCCQKHLDEVNQQFGTKMKMNEFVREYVEGDCPYHKVGCVE